MSLLWSAGEQVRAEGAEAERREGGESHRGAQCRSDDVFLKADLYHRGGDAELGRRDEGRRWWLARGQRGESMDDEIERDEREGHQEQVGVVDQRADVQTRAEHDEEQGDEKAFGDPADLSRQTLRSSDRGHDEPHGESPEEHAGAALLRDPSQSEEHRQCKTQIQRPTASLGALS